MALDIEKVEQTMEVVHRKICGMLESVILDAHEIKELTMALAILHDKLNK